MSEEKNFEEEIAERIKKEEERENSIEGVMYNLGTIGEIMVEDEGDKLLIAKTLLKIPKEIRENVLEGALFVHAGLGNLGYVWNLYSNEIVTPKNTKRIGKFTFLETSQPLIVLNFALMRKEELTESEIMDVIAHEIAHFVLGDHMAENMGDPHNEREANDLIEKWGFKRGYESYEQIEKMLGKETEEQ